MDTLRKFFPSAKELLALSVDDLAPFLLRVAKDLQNRGSGMFWSEPYFLVGDTSQINDNGGYPHHTKPAVERLLQKTLSGLERNGLIVPAPGQNGRNGYKQLTSAGEQAAKSKDAYESLRAAQAFPKTLLHPSIADAVWSALLRGDLDDAVLKSFRAVEGVGPKCRKIFRNGYWGPPGA